MTSPTQRSPRSQYLVFGRPVVGDAEIAEVVDSLRSGWIGTGPKVARFEGMLREYVGVPYIRALGSCTAALMLALRVLDIGDGDEVIVPAMTFVATVNAIEHAGARPVFVDCEPRTALVDLDAVVSAITDKTAAVMAVHLYGRPIDMDRLNGIRDGYGVAIIEDAAHALGAEWKGQRIGSHGNIAAYSFYVTKNITTIEGGALVTDDPAISERVERLALHGLSTGAWQRFSDEGYRHYEVVEPGFKFNMTDVNAAIGLHQLPMLDEWIDHRAALWHHYDKELVNLPIDTPTNPEPMTRHARHLYTVGIGGESQLSRDEVLQVLHNARIGAGVHYRGVHLHPFYRDKYELSPEAFPVASDISNRTLSLPLSPDVTEDDLADVVSVLRSAVGS